MDANGEATSEHEKHTDDSQSVNQNQNNISKQDQDGVLQISKDEDQNLALTDDSHLEDGDDEASYGEETSDDDDKSFDAEWEEKIVNSIVSKALENAIEIVKHSAVDVQFSSQKQEDVQTESQINLTSSLAYDSISETVNGHEYSLKESYDSREPDTSNQMPGANLASYSQGEISVAMMKDDHSATTSGGAVNIHIPYGMVPIHPIRGISYEDVRHAQHRSMFPGQVSQSLPNVPGFPASPSPTYRNLYPGRMSKNSRRSQLPKISSTSSSQRVDFNPRESARSRRSPPRASPRPPPNITKMSIVMDKTRRRTEKQRATSVYFEEKQSQKVLTLDQCINSRPPMPYDLDGPGPWSYSAPSKPLYETNAPSYTFGTKFNEKNGGGRTAWAKTWFNSPDNYSIKVKFEKRWPTPATHISSRSLVGRRIAFKPEFPSYSIGVRSKLAINKYGSENEPSPNEYTISKSDGVIFRKAPAFSMTFRHRGTSLWGNAEKTPSPALYTPRLCTSTAHHPAFTIRGIRRPKSHMLGPHATL